MFKLFSIFNKMFLTSSAISTSEPFDDSESFVNLINQYQNDPLSLVYLSNFLTKRYVLRRSRAVLLASKGKANYQPSSNFLTPLPTGEKIETPHKINLQSSAVLSWVWSANRLDYALNNFGNDTDTPWRYEDNHRLIFIFPMCYTEVKSGNHSLTAGILKGDTISGTQTNYMDAGIMYKLMEFRNGVFYPTEGKPMPLYRDAKILGVLFQIGELILKLGFSYEDYVDIYYEKYDHMSSKIADYFVKYNTESQNFIKDFYINNV